MGFLSKLTGWKALIAIAVAIAAAMFGGGIKIVKILGWAVAAIIAVIAAWGEIRS